MKILVQILILPEKIFLKISIFFQIKVKEINFLSRRFLQLKHLVFLFNIKSIFETDKYLLKNCKWARKNVFFFSKGLEKYYIFALGSAKCNNGPVCNIGIQQIVLYNF